MYFICTGSLKLYVMLGSSGLGPNAGLYANSHRRRYYLRGKSGPKTMDFNKGLHKKCVWLSVVFL